jgi:anti-sigma factor RsiW
VKSLKCPEEIIELMHAFLDEDIEPEKEIILREHLKSCKECESIFNELNKTIALVRSSSNMQAPPRFTEMTMSRLPKEKKRARMGRWLQNHPFLAAASLFFILMMTSLMSSWNQDHQFSVSEQKNLIVKNHTVIVPKGEVVKGDVIVQNGKLRIEGEVKGNVTVINGTKYLASAGHVTGDIKEVNQVFDWIWYHLKKTGKDIIYHFNGNNTN